MTYSKYTFDYDPAIEALLDSALAEISKEITDSPISKYLKYIVLGGGYGRGEGGILKRENGENCLYNDLDFFVITNTVLPCRNTQIREFFKKLSAKWHRKLGIDVDFSTPRTASYIRRREHVMVWREMICASTIIYGKSEEFKSFFSHTLPKMPPSETAKLLINRMSGLFMVKQKLFQENLSYPDYDFIARNINKAILACGDAVLLAHDKYAFKTASRLANLENLQLENAGWMAMLRERYEKAVAFKKHPQISQDKVFCVTQCQIASRLCIETVQLISSFLSNSKEELLSQKIKKIRIFFHLRKKFRSLGIKLSLAKDPYLCSIMVLGSFLENSEETSKVKEDLYLEVWRSGIF